MFSVWFTQNIATRVSDRNLPEDTGNFPSPLQKCVLGLLKVFDNVANKTLIDALQQVYC